MRRDDDDEARTLHLDQQIGRIRPRKAFLLLLDPPLRCSSHCSFPRDGTQGDDVFAVWGAGGGAAVDQTGFDPPYAKCGLSNAPASDVVFRRTFAKGISDWSSCAHLFGAGGNTCPARNVTDLQTWASSPWLICCLRIPIPRRNRH